MKLDFLIPASPIREFFSQIAMFRLALDRLGGIYRDARLVVVFGDRQRAPLPREWRTYFDRIEIEWADADEFERLGYRAQGDRRFELMRSDADLVFMCDADTLVLRPFSSDVFELARQDAIGGVIAHYHFPWQRSSGDPVVDWDTISRAVIGAEIDLKYRYTLLDCGRTENCPFYINLGFLVGSPKMLRLLHESIASIREKVRGALNNYFDAQVALALAVSQKKIPAKALPMRYNFPNDLIADQLYPVELADICVLHYLRHTVFGRQKIFSSEADFYAFLKLDLEGSNKVFQKFVEPLTEGVYPFR